VFMSDTTVLPSDDNCQTLVVGRETTVMPDRDGENCYNVPAIRETYERMFRANGLLPRSRPG